MLICIYAYLNYRLLRHKANSSDTFLSCHLTLLNTLEVNGLKWRSPLTLFSASNLVERVAVMQNSHFIE